MKEWTASELLSLSSAHWNSALLQTAVRLNIFTLLAEAPRSGSELAAATGCNPRALSMLLTSLVAAKLINMHTPAPQKDTGPAGFAHCLGTVYAASPSAAQYLARTSPDFLGFIIEHHYHLQPAWHQLGASVQKGEPMRGSSSDTNQENEREAFLMGMFNVAVHQAQTVAEHLDFSGCGRLLDVGGGPGTYAIYFCRKNPGLAATIFDKPTTRPYAEAIVRRYALAERIDFAGGDLIEEELPHGYHAAWISQILHGNAPEQAAEIVAKAARTLLPGGLLCIQEFMLEDTLDGPLFPALFSLNMLVGTQGGQAYTRAELVDMLRRAGATGIRQVDMALPQGCAVLVGTMPQ